MALFSLKEHQKYSRYKNPDRASRMIALSALLATAWASLAPFVSPQSFNVEAGTPTPVNSELPLKHLSKCPVRDDTQPNSTREVPINSFIPYTENRQIKILDAVNRAKHPNGYWLTADTDTLCVGEIYPSGVTGSQKPLPKVRITQRSDAPMIVEMTGSTTMNWIDQQSDGYRGILYYYDEKTHMIHAYAIDGKLPFFPNLHPLTRIPPDTPTPSPTKTATLKPTASATPTSSRTATQTSTRTSTTTSTPSKTKIFTLTPTLTLTRIPIIPSVPVPGTPLPTGIFVQPSPKPTPKATPASMPSWEKTLQTAMQDPELRKTMGIIVIVSTISGLGVSLAYLKLAHPWLKKTLTDTRTEPARQPAPTAQPEIVAKLNVGPSTNRPTTLKLNSEQTKSKIDLRFLKIRRESILNQLDGTLDQVDRQKLQKELAGIDTTIQSLQGNK